MMKGCRLYLGIVILLLQVTEVTAQRKYQYACLERIATSLQLSSKLDTLRNGTFTYTYQSKPIKVCIDKGRIHHIGYDLFPAMFRNLSYSAIYDFIERYLLELHLAIGNVKDVNTRMKQDGVNFYRGNIGVIFSLIGNNDLNVQMEELDGKVCKLTLGSGQETCILSFPVEYDLLHSTDMLESERNIVEDLSLIAKDLLYVEYPDTFSLVSLSNGLFVNERGSFYTEQLSANQYFTLTNGTLFAVYDKAYIEESLANLFSGLIPKNQYKIRIQLIKYNYQSEELYLSLNQLIRYCQDSNCQSFLGLIGIKNEVAECEWIMKNEEEGYCHVMRVYVPLRQWEHKIGEISIRLNSYIPISKIKNLYEEKNK